MSRVATTKSTAPGKYPIAGVALTMTAADATNKNAFAMTGQELLLAYNNHATDPKTVTVNSTPCSHGRSQDITAESLVAGAWRLYGPFKQKQGWQQSDGTLHFEGEDNNIKFAVVLLPSLA